MTAIVFGGMAVVFAACAGGALEAADRLFRRPASAEARAVLRSRHRGPRWVFAILAVASAWQCVDAFRLAARQG
ncbi:hypothetical protein ACFQ8C_01865 [Streptomyces sp. NPDC056503]|uniref:hypothetical protein n=1 Tax=Streptomyces sp. NPDC056503 TaxID=3345842 RepID=UPI00368E5768